MDHQKYDQLIKLLSSAQHILKQMEFFLIWIRKNEKG